MCRLTLAVCLVAVVFVSIGQVFAGRYYGPTMGPLAYVRSGVAEDASE